MHTKVKVLLTILIFWGLIAPHSAVAGEKPRLQAESAVLMDYKTGEILHEKNMHKRLPPASTTKIMTAIIALESGKLDDKVKISAKAASTSGSSMHLYSGQVISMRELIIGLLMRSGNDAAVAIAEHLAGSNDAFVNLMNQKALLIGAYNTHFRNPHGLSAPGHYSSAFDLALITRYALNNPLFRQIVGTKETSIEWLDRQGREKDINLRNTNKLLWMLDDADGVKTGTTNLAGPCLVSSATRGNQKLIAVVLHDHSRWYDSLHLLKYGFEHYELYSYMEQGDVYTTLPVDGGMDNLASIIVNNIAAVVVAAEDYAKVQTKVDLPEKIKAPIYKGQKVGEIIFYVAEKPIKTVDLVSSQDIEEQTISKVILTHFIKTLRQLSNFGLI